MKVTEKVTTSVYRYVQASRTFHLNFLVSKVINKCLWDWRGIFVVEHCLVCSKLQVHPRVLQQTQKQHIRERNVSHCLLHLVHGTVTAAWSRVRRRSGVQQIPWELLLVTQMEMANRSRKPPNQILIGIMQYHLSPLFLILSRKTLWFWVAGTGQILDRQQA